MNVFKFRSSSKDDLNNSKNNEKIDPFESKLKFEGNQSKNVLKNVMDLSSNNFMVPMVNFKFDRVDDVITQNSGTNKFKRT